METGLCGTCGQPTGGTRYCTEDDRRISRCQETAQKLRRLEVLIEELNAQGKKLEGSELGELGEWTIWLGMANSIRGACLADGTPQPRITTGRYAGRFAPSNGTPKEATS